GDHSVRRVRSGELSDGFHRVPESHGHELGFANAASGEEIRPAIACDAVDSWEDLPDQELPVGLRVFGLGPAEPDPSDHRRLSPRGLSAKRKKGSGPCGTGAVERRKAA